MNIFVTSDLHLGHGNIIEYANRPFHNSTEMNAKLIQYWNERVKPEDQIFHVGDFCFKSGPNCDKADNWLRRLNGQKIMIRGNHDNNNSCKTIVDCVHISFANYRMNLVHKPEHANPDFPINIVGHVHGAWKIRTFKEHYDAIEKIHNMPNSDRQDFANFLVARHAYRESDSILFNCGVDVNNYRPVLLNEVIGQISKWKNTK